MSTSTHQVVVAASTRAFVTTCRLAPKRPLGRGCGLVGGRLISTDPGGLLGSSGGSTDTRAHCGLNALDGSGCALGARAATPTTAREGQWAPRHVQRVGLISIPRVSLRSSHHQPPLSALIGGIIIRSVGSGPLPP
jgi:hypothetical protein